MKIDARFLVRLYPRKWRERYGEELVAMTSRTGVGRAEAADIVRAAVRQRIFEHGRMPEILLMTIGLLPGAFLIAAGLSGLATVLAARLHFDFGPIAVPLTVVRPVWLLSSVLALICAFRRTATNGALVQCAGLYFAAAVLNKWSCQPWMHPVVTSDIETWFAFGRIDATFFAALGLELWMRWATPRINTILATYPSRASR